MDARLASMLWCNSPEVTDVKGRMSLGVEHKLLRPPVTAHFLSTSACDMSVMTVDALCFGTLLFAEEKCRQ